MSSTTGLAKTDTPVILVVDDEAGVRDLLGDALRLGGYETFEATDGMAALTALRKRPANLLVIDINMPLMDGFELLERLRDTGDLTPALMLSARGDKSDIARGLRLGADDYVTKPFSLEELLLRVAAILRRSAPKSSSAPILRCGPIQLNDDLHLVTLNEEVVELSPTEYRLLQYLMEHKGKVLSKTTLLSAVWEIDFDSESTVVDTYISYLRKKLNRDDLEFIRTVRGVGFQLVEPK
jgi:two-component system, OmpR family, response regulator